jgi:quercetin dioxygenase-like cupin family protein
MAGVQVTKRVSAPLRPPLIQDFIDAWAACLTRATVASPDNTAFVARLLSRLGAPAASILTDRRERPAVCQHIRPVLDGLGEAPDATRRLAETFFAIEPFLPWSKRTHAGPDADRFAEGHANGLILGPSGLEKREDVLVGVSIMAPHIRYPDHSHPPDELYFVLTEGEWWREGQGWFRPGPGGTVRNPPGVLHAMRSGPAPLMAIWALLVT